MAAAQSAANSMRQKIIKNVEFENEQEIFTDLTSIQEIFKKFINQIS